MIDELGEIDLKLFRYHTSGIRLKTKKKILEAYNLGLKITRIRDCNNSILEIKKKRKFKEMKNLNPGKVKILNQKDRRVMCRVCGHIWWIHPGSHKISWQCKNGCETIKDVTHFNRHNLDASIIQSDFVNKKEF